MYRRINGSVKKYDETTHDYVEVVNDVIIGQGDTLIIKTDSKYVCWEKFDKPNSLKGYGEYAVATTQALYASAYRLSDAGTPVYYDDATDVLTLTAGGNENAVVDGTDSEELESNLLSDGSVVLKDVGVLVSCSDLNRQSIIATGQEDLNDKELRRNCAKALIDNHDATQDLAVFNSIKDEDLTGADFDTICETIMGV